MSEPRKNHLTIDGGQSKEEEHADSYKPIPEADQEFRTSKSSLGKSKEKVSDPAEEKLLQKEDEAKITRMATEAKYDHRNGDTKIELDAAKKQFTGLTKEELQKYADDPFWVRLRWFMFVLFWALWLAMLAGAIAIIIRAPKCAAPTPKTWYELGPLVDWSSESAVDYTQLETELQSLQTAKVKGVFINPCENTYDVLVDSTCIDKFKEFLKKAQEKSIKLIVDLTANFVPTTHDWFIKSENKSEPYTDYFVWGVHTDFNDATGKPKLPNNWVSLHDNEPAWTWSDKRKQYYLHQYRAEQADLNFHNADVVKQFQGVLQKWMDAGAAGVRLLKARQLVVNKQLLSNPIIVTKPGEAVVKERDFYVQKMTIDQPELDTLFTNWTNLVTQGGEKVFTLHEDGSIRPEWFRLRGAATLRPPAAAPLRLATNITTFVTHLNNATEHWPALQLSAENPENNEELSIVAMLLKATPVLAPAQIPDRDNDTQAFGHLAALRDEASVKFGEQLVAAVPANNSTTSSDDILAVARWKPGQPGYVAVFNPGESPANASLTGLAHMPDSLTVHYLTPQAKLATGYTINTPVPAGAVEVPGRAALVLSYVPKTEATE